MENKEKHIKSSVSILQDEQLKLFYEDILLVVEGEFNAFGKAEQLEKYAKAHGFGIEHKDYRNSMLSPQDDVFYFSADVQTPSNTKHYTNVTKNWYKHLRNAFAHNNIVRDGEMLVLNDFHPNKKKEKTLYARISSFERFAELVKAMKQLIVEVNK